MKNSLNLFQINHFHIKYFLMHSNDFCWFWIFFLYFNYFSSWYCLFSSDGWCQVVNFKPLYLCQFLTDFHEIFMPMPEIPSSVKLQWNSTTLKKFRDSNRGPSGNLTIHVISWHNLNFKPLYLCQFLTDFHEIFMTMKGISNSFNLEWNPNNYKKILSCHVILPSTPPVIQWPSG